MKRKEHLGLAGAWILAGALLSPPLAGSAHASYGETDYARCKSGIVRTGMTLREVRKRCGRKLKRDLAYNAPVFVDGDRLVGSEYVEIWSYQRRGNFRRIFTFRNGALATIEIGER